MIDRSADDGPPRVTVGIFGYNHEEYIAEAIRSVFSSSFEDWELIVVDDASADATLERIRCVAAERPGAPIRILADGVNRGLASRINQVVELARSPWLAVLGGDDAFLPDGLARLVSGSDEGVDVVWGDLEVMDSTGKSKGYARPRDTWQGSVARKYLTPGPVGADILRFNNFVSGTSPLVRIQTLRQVGGYTPGCRNEDLDMWLRLGRDHAFKYVEGPVARYRVVAASVSRAEASAVLDQAAIVHRLLTRGDYPRAGLARLLVMRWLLMVARSRGRPRISLSELASASGLSRSELLRQVPRAGIDPLALSAQAFLRRER